MKFTHLAVYNDLNVCVYFLQKNLKDDIKNVRKNDKQEMKESKAVYVTKQKIREDQNLVYQFHESERKRRIDNKNNFGSQYDSKKDNTICTCKNVVVKKHHEVRYFSGLPKQVYAYHGSRCAIDVGVGSVKALQRRQVKRVYLPETDDTGVGSADLSSFIFRRKFPKVINNYFDQKKTSSKCIGGILEYNTGCVINEKLSPIIQTKCASTSPKLSLVLKINTEIGSSTIKNMTNTKETQFEVKTSEIIMEAKVEKQESTAHKAPSRSKSKAMMGVVIAKPAKKVSEQTQKSKCSEENTEEIKMKIKKYDLGKKKKEPNNTCSIEAQKTGAKEFNNIYSKEAKKTYSFKNPNKTQTNEPDKIHSKKPDTNCSSDSLVQHVHNLENSEMSDENHSRTSFPDPMENKLEREYRKMFSTTKSKESRASDDKPIPQFKSASKLRRRFEALRRGIAKKEDSKNKVSSQLTKTSNSQISTHKDASMTSDPPSLVSKSFSNPRPHSPGMQDKKKDNYKSESYRKEKTSSNWQQNSMESDSQGVKGMFKLWGKRFNFEEDAYDGKRATLMPSYDKSKKSEKDIQPKTSTNKKEKQNKKFFFFKKKSKDTTKDPIMPKKDVTAGRCEIKDGLVLKFGPSKAKIKQNISEEGNEITRKTWLRKFLTETIESARSVNVRWNNNRYATSSSTVFKLVDSVYKNTGVVIKSECDMTTAESSYYKSFTKQVNFVQDIEAWMIPRTIPDIPFRQLAVRQMPIRLPPMKQIPLRINSESEIDKKKEPDQKWSNKNSEAFANKIEIVLQSNNIQNLPHFSYKKASSEYLKINIPADFFDTSSYESKRSQSSDEKVFKIVEYETNSEIGRSRKTTDETYKSYHDFHDIKVIVSIKDSKSVEPKIIESGLKTPPHKDVVTQRSPENITKRCDVIEVGIITQRDLREMRKPILKIQEPDLSDEESEPEVSLIQKKCEFAESYLQEYYRHWTPLGMDPWCASESFVQTSSEKSMDGSKSCPNICEDFQTVTTVTPCEAPSIPCKHCTYEELTKRHVKLYNKMISKFMKPGKAKTDPEFRQSSTSKEKARRVFPKDSLEVYKKRQMSNASGARWRWVTRPCGEDKFCCVPSVSDIVCSHDGLPLPIPNCSPVSKKLFNSSSAKPKYCKHVWMPDCESLNDSIDRALSEKPEGILQFKGNANCDICRKTGKHAVIQPYPACEMPAPPCKTLCDDMKTPHCMKPNSPSCNMPKKTSKCGLPVCPKPPLPPECGIVPLVCLPKQPDCKIPICPSGLPICTPPPCHQGPPCVNPPCKSPPPCNKEIEKLPSCEKSPCATPTPPCEHAPPCTPIGTKSSSCESPSICKKMVYDKPPSRKSSSPTSCEKPLLPCDKPCSPPLCSKILPRKNSCCRKPHSCCMSKQPSCSKCSSRLPCKSSPCKHVQPCKTPPPCNSPPRCKLPVPCKPSTPCKHNPPCKLPPTCKHTPPCKLPQPCKHTPPCKLPPPPPACQFPPPCTEFPPCKPSRSNCFDPSSAFSTDNIVGQLLKDKISNSSNDNVFCCTAATPCCSPPPPTHEYTIPVKRRSPENNRSLHCADQLPLPTCKSCIPSPSCSIPSTHSSRSLSQCPTPNKSPYDLSKPCDTPKLPCDPVQPCQTKIPRKKPKPLCQPKPIQCELLPKSAMASVGVSPCPSRAGISLKQLPSPREQLCAGSKQPILKQDPDCISLRSNLSCCDRTCHPLPDLTPKLAGIPIPLPPDPCHPEQLFSSKRCVSTLSPRSCSPNRSKKSGIHLKMEPAGKITSNDCIHCVSHGNIKLKEATPSTQEIRELMNIKVQDEDGSTLYERKDYVCENQRDSVVGDLYRASKVQRVSTPITVTNMVADDQKKTLITKKSEPSLANLVNINLKLRIVRGDKITEVNVGNNNEEQRKLNNSIKKSNPEIFVVNNRKVQQSEAIEETPKNDINIKIIVRNFKPKHKTATSTEKTCTDEFSKNISEKFHNVSTGYSDVEEENIYSVHRATINLTSSAYLSNVSKMSHIVASKEYTDNERNYTVSSHSTDAVHTVTEITEDENAGDIISKKPSNIKTITSTESDFPDFDEVNTQDSELAKLVSSDEYSDHVLSKISSKEEKKVLLKKVFQEASKRSGNKENVRELRKKLKIILTDSSAGSNEETNISSNDLAKDVTYTSLKPNYFRDTDSMNNYYKVENNYSSLRESRLEAIYPTVEPNTSSSKSSDTSDANDITFQGCMCSKVAERLNNANIVKINGCCCRAKLIHDEETSCDLKCAADYFLLNYKTTEQIDVETQNSRNQSNYVNRIKQSVLSTTKKSHEKTSNTTHDYEDVAMVKSPITSSKIPICSHKTSSAVSRRKSLAKESTITAIESDKVVEEIRHIQSPRLCNISTKLSQRKNLTKDYRNKPLVQDITIVEEIKIVKKCSPKTSKNISDDIPVVEQINVVQSCSRRTSGKVTTDITVVEEIKILSPKSVKTKRASNYNSQRRMIGNESDIKSFSIGKEANINSLYKNANLGTFDEEQMRILTRKLNELSAERKRQELDKSGESDSKRGDALQTFAAKKAVLEIYAEKTAIGGNFVAKLPKFVLRRESELASHCDQFTSNSLKSVCKENVFIMSVEQ